MGKPYYKIYQRDSTLLYGICFPENESTKVDLIYKKSSSLLIDKELTDLFYVNSELLCYYSYESNVFGVFDINSNEKIWEKRLLNSKLLYLGVSEGVNNYIIYQTKSAAYLLDPYDGSIIEKSIIDGELAAFSYGRKMIFKRRKLIFSNVNGVLKEWSVNDYAKLVRITNDYVTFIIWQGALVILDINKNKEILKLNPENNMQFTDVSYNKKMNSYFVSYYYFGDTRTIYVARIDSSASLKIDGTKIELSGPHILIDDGKAVAFACRQIYSTSSGQLIDKF